MTKRYFSTVVMDVIETIREEKTIKDVLLMMRLGFTPETWKVWKPQLRQLFEIQTYENENSENEITKDRVVYDKKQKLWFIQDIK